MNTNKSTEKLTEQAAYFFVDVVLPIPVERYFTYQITEAEAGFLKKGMRVMVPFGKNKIYTALVYQLHQNPPTAYEAKQIHQILDEYSLVNETQFSFWEWISSYYMCTVGEVMRASLPSAFLLESETIIFKNADFENEDELTDDEFLVLNAFTTQSQLSIADVTRVLQKVNCFPIVKKLLDKKAIRVREEVYEQYKPKMIEYVRLNQDLITEDDLNAVIDSVQRAKKQHKALLTYFSLEASTKKPIKTKDLVESSGVSRQVIKSLVDKSIFEFYSLQVDRVVFDKATDKLKTLSDSQERAYAEIKESFLTHSVVLLHGVTSSGKTEVYTKLIQEQLTAKKQVLFLLPEIALTTQIIGRLKNVFGEQIVVFHSKYSMNERVEAWNNVLNSGENPKIILGARSSVLLPFSNLGLIIVDEEHETSYKQFDPSPRYNARDAAVVLAKMHNAKVVLGSATPSIETFFNAQNSKYGLVSLQNRFGDVQMPSIQLVDIKEKHRKKRMTHHFSDVLIKEIQEALQQKEQVILFQNRRGYSPVVECETCGVSPQCPNCDVSLTFHKYHKELRCHYCNYRQAMPTKCGACGSEKLNTLGFGTEQIEAELKELFPQAGIGRMDLDTTRGKYGYEKIINSFQAQEIDILVGTQMLSKGLDFGNVTLVGVMNADNMLNFPDFRAHEKTFQMLVQVSGRSGRSQKQGKVLIQTFNPYHQILQQVSNHAYELMYKEQLQDRWHFKYPPYYRILRITLKHRSIHTLDTAAQWLGKSLTNAFHENVLGPTAPNISRIRNLYIKQMVVKIPPEQSLTATKKHILKIKSTFLSVAAFRAVRLGIDVDAY